MKKLLLIIFMISALHSDDISIEKSIFESIFTAINSKQSIKVYVNDPIESLNLKSEKFILVQNCLEADIVVMKSSDLDPSCQKVPVFGTRYRHLDHDFVIGSFFWQKGRPNILFYQDRLDKKGIKLDKSMQDYVE